jgi:hypothetical protein
MSTRVKIILAAISLFFLFAFIGACAYSTDIGDGSWNEDIFMGAFFGELFSVALFFYGAFRR